LALVSKEPVETMSALQALPIPEAGLGMNPAALETLMALPAATFLPCSTPQGNSAIVATKVLAK